jgi:hypothetical protein
MTCRDGREQRGRRANNRCHARMFFQNGAMKSLLLKLAPGIAVAAFIFNLPAAKAADEIAAANSTSTLRLAAIFGDNMVLQRQQTVPVWGWAAPDADVTPSGARRSPPQNFWIGTKHLCFGAKNSCDEAKERCDDT